MPFSPDASPCPRRPCPWLRGAWLPSGDSIVGRGGRSGRLASLWPFGEVGFPLAPARPRPLLQCMSETGAALTVTEEFEGQEWALRDRTCPPVTAYLKQKKARRPAPGELCSSPQQRKVPSSDAPTWAGGGALRRRSFADAFGGVQHRSPPSPPAGYPVFGWFCVTSNLGDWGPAAPSLSPRVLSRGPLHIRRPCRDAALSGCLTQP